MNDYEELGTIYESRILNEGAIQNLGVVIKDGLSKGLDIFDIIRTHLQEFISIMAIVSSFSFGAKLNSTYQNHPEILQQHSEYADKAVQEIGQFLSDNPKILNIFLKK